jgi:hypothetical protein
MDTPVNLIFNKIDELPSTVEFINWLLENENVLIAKERNIIIQSFDLGNSSRPSDGEQYYFDTFCLE